MQRTHWRALKSTGHTAANEKEFGYQIRQALNEAAAGLDYKTTYRLEQARAAALARHRGRLPHRPGTRLFGRRARPMAARASAGSAAFGLASSMVALIVGFIGIYQWRQQQLPERMSDLAAMDFAVLMDETPIGACTDKDSGIPCAVKRKTCRRRLLHVKFVLFIGLAALIAAAWALPSHKHLPAATSPKQRAVTRPSWSESDIRAARGAAPLAGMWETLEADRKKNGWKWRQDFQGFTGRQKRMHERMGSTRA